MRKLWLILVLLIRLGPAHGQTYAHFEFENVFNLKPVSLFQPQITLYGKTIKEDARFGAYFFSLLNPNWGQTYGGILYRPARWITLNAGVGLERDSLPWRVSAGAFMAHKKVTLLQVYEYGGSGFWYNIVLHYHFSDLLRAGMTFKRFYGLGPDVEISIPRSPVTLVVAPFYDFEFGVPRLFLSFRYGFY